MAIYIGRREFIVTLGGTVAWPLAAHAQQPAMPVIGVLRVNAKDVNEAFVGPFPRYMRALGWEEGRNISFQFRWAAGRNDQLPVLAREFAAQKVNLIITFGNPAVQAVQRATTTIPIVGMTDDMVGAGLAASMARPGGNTTGVSILGTELDVKRHELLHEFVPQARRVAALADPNQFTNRPQLENASRVFGVDLSIFAARNRDEIGPALDAMGQAQVEAVNILASPILNGSRGCDRADSLTRASTTGRRGDRIGGSFAANCGEGVAGDMTMARTQEYVHSSALAPASA